MIDKEKYWLKVVGTSFRVEAFEEMFGRERDGVNHVVTAHLGLEPSNPYDPNAVRVQIQGYHVGYLSRDDAILYRDFVDPDNGLEVEGYVNGGKDRGYYGLNLAAPQEWRTAFDIDLDKVFKSQNDEVL